jgi:hypothetical protein
MEKNNGEIMKRNIKMGKRGRRKFGKISGKENKENRERSIRVICLIIAKDSLFSLLIKNNKKIAEVIVASIHQLSLEYPKKGLKQYHLYIHVQNK